MDLEKEKADFESWATDKFPIAGLGQFEKHNNGTYIQRSIRNMYEAWQAAKAHETKKLDGCVVVSNKPYAYIIKHKHWSDSTPTEIYLATEFVGDGCVEKEKLIICIPLYKGEEALRGQNDSR